MGVGDGVDGRLAVRLGLLLRTASVPSNVIVSFLVSFWFVGQSGDGSG